MLTLGDVWAITAVIVGVAVCAWALLLCLTLIFQARAQYARDLIVRRPGKLVFSGLLVTLVFGALSVLLLNSPNGAIKLLGWIVLLALMAVSFVGSSGLVRLAGERVQELDSGLSGYGSLSRGTLFVVLPSVLPILGWFLYAPLVFCVGVGAGYRVLRMPERQPEPEPLLV